MAVPYLQVDNLTKSFGDLVLFENISFGIAEGQRVGLIAKNGSGKTTLLNIISGKEGRSFGAHGSGKSMGVRTESKADSISTENQKF